MDARAAERIDPNPNPGRSDCLPIDDAGEVGDIRSDVVVAMNTGRFARALVEYSLYALEVIFEKRLQYARSRL